MKNLHNKIRFDKDIKISTFKSYGKLLSSMNVCFVGIILKKTLYRCSFKIVSKMLA